MEELKGLLEDVISKFEKLTDEHNRQEVISGNYRLLNKKVEDGILNNMLNANEKQYNQIMKGYTFKYYVNFNNDREALKNEVIKRTREIKLNKLLK